MRPSLVLCALLSLSSSVVSIAPALACGGTFCDRPTPANPTPMPVNQTGENILFVLDQGFVEAHVQIQYNGNPSRFAWIVPIPAKPTLSIGSQPLFTNMLSATVPTYSYTNTSACNAASSQKSFGCGASADSASASADFGSGGRDDGGVIDEPDAEKLTVGAFDAAILSNGNAAGITKWLDDNGYQLPDDLENYLQSYVEKNSVFVAVRLTPDTVVSEIHPLVLRYAGDEPCVPIKLTAVAAEEDMGIRAFFLADSRAVPTNYKHVILNESSIDYSNLASNYDDVVASAVDSPIADGHAFVTEFAGPSSIISTDGVISNTWTTDSYRGLSSPAEAIAELKNQGLITCQFVNRPYCVPAHPLLAGLLNDFTPLAPGFTSYEQVLRAPDLYADQLDSTNWDPDAFANAFEERIRAPGEHAQDILRGHYYLTRMFTRISPSEMNQDPTFHLRDDLGDVSNQHSAQALIQCNGQASYTLSDGRIVNSNFSSSWPATGTLDAAERVEEIPLHGEPFTLLNNKASIDGKLDAWNKSAAIAPTNSSNDSSPDCNACVVSRKKRTSVPLIGLTALALAWLSRRATRRDTRLGATRGLGVLTLSVPDQTS